MYYACVDFTLECEFIVYDAVFSDFQRHSQAFFENDFTLLLLLLSNMIAISNRHNQSKRTICVCWDELFYLRNIDVC